MAAALALAFQLVGTVSPGYAQLPSLLWAAGMVGSGPHLGMGVGIAVDGVGNVYTTGYFRGTIDFDPGPGTFHLTSVGLDDNTFVQKMDAGGNFLWAVGMAAGARSDEALDIAVDRLGNVYTTGTFTGTADFDPGPGTFHLASAGDRDIFVQKLDTSGNLLWAVGMGQTIADRGLAIAVDGAGNVYTTGTFGFTVDFDPGPGTFNLGSGSLNIFVQKLDTNGNFLWAVAMSGLTFIFGGNPGFGIAVDGAGNVYTTGGFGGTVDFDPGPGTFHLTGAVLDIFVQKLDAGGNFLWATAIGGIPFDLGLDIAIDGLGNAYTTGFFQGTVDFDPGPGTFHLTSAGGTDVFVQKLDASGNFLWAAGFGNTFESWGLSLALDGSGNVYTTGFFRGTVDFDPGPGTFQLTFAGSEDIFVQKLDASGNFGWAVQFGGFALDQGFGIAVDASSNIHTTGFFGGTVDFDPGPGTFNLTGNFDVFVQKLGGSADSDGDGVPDNLDLCPETVIPETSVPSVSLGVNRWALVDGDTTFDTISPPGGGNGPELSFTVDDTGGCSCEQIIVALGLGEGHEKHGCSISAMREWVGALFTDGFESGNLSAWSGPFL